MRLRTPLTSSEAAGSLVGGRPVVPAAGDPPILEARGITKSFGGQFANESIDFVVRAGEVRALLGENGAGKTTLISILCGQYQPDHGQLLVHGRSLQLGSPRAALNAGIGVVHQDFRLVPRFTVTENVLLGTAAWGGRHFEREIGALARDVGFHLDPTAHAWQLSVGELQQLAILKLLYRGSDILILDEPTAVLSPQKATEMFRSLRRLTDQGKAVIFITHRLREVTEAADWVTVLRKGRVMADQPVAGLRHADLAALMVGDTDVSRGDLSDKKPGDPILTLSAVTVEAAGLMALDALDLQVFSGEIVGVAGISGNGQLELAEVAAGVIEPSTGRRDCRTKAVGYIPEDRLASGLVGAMSIADNLAFRSYDRPPLSRRMWLWTGRITAMAKRLIDEFGLPVQRSDSKVADLSGGGLQRVLVAREIFESPDLLVAAQPTRGLDVLSARAVRSQLVDARDRGAGVLLISEDLDEILEVSDRIVVMFKGRLVADFAHGTVTRVELGLRMGGGQVES